MQHVVCIMLVLGNNRYDAPSRGYACMLHKCLGAEARESRGARDEYDRLAISDQRSADRQLRVDSLTLDHAERGSFTFFRCNTRRTG